MRERVCVLVREVRWCVKEGERERESRAHTCTQSSECVHMRVISLFVSICIPMMRV